MPRNLFSIRSTIAFLLFTMTNCFAYAYESETTDLIEPTVADIADYLDSKNGIQTKSGTNFEFSNTLLIQRLSNNTAGAAGSIIISIHKSDVTEKPEYIEVFIQNSNDPNDLIEQYLFDNGTTNQALASTGGVYSGKLFPTPSGVFSIDSMEKMHYSSLYNNAPMPWTIFFNGGIALHGASPAGIAKLGQKASHGCVRLHPDNAKILYEFIKSKGGQLSKNVLIKVQDQ